MYKKLLGVLVEQGYKKVLLDTPAVAVKSHHFYENAGFKVGAGLVWKKDRLVLTRTDWKYIHEPIIWGWRKDGKHIWYGDQKQKTVFEFDRIKNSKEDGCGHPSSKPVPLIAYLIGLSTT